MLSLAAIHKVVGGTKASVGILLSTMGKRRRLIPQVAGW